MNLTSIERRVARLMPGDQHVIIIGNAEEHDKKKTQNGEVQDPTRAPARATHGDSAGAGAGKGRRLHK